MTDFIELPYWPSFNVADTAITFAVLLILWNGARDPGSPQPGATPAPTERVRPP